MGAQGVDFATSAVADKSAKQDAEVPSATTAGYPTPWSLWTMVGALTASIALACAALSGHSGGWFTYKQKNWTYFLFEAFPRTKPPQPFTLSFWIGYVRGTSSLRKHLVRIAHIRPWRYLKEGGMIAQVTGGVEAALLGISVIAAVVVVVMCVVALLRRSGRLQAGRAAWLSNGPNMTLLLFFAAPFSAVLGVISILFYIMMIIGVKREALTELMMPHLIIWPDWAWWFAILVAAIWGLTAGFASRERRAMNVAAPQGEKTAPV